MRVVFLGRGRIGMDLLRDLLVEPSVEVCAVYTCRHSPEVGLSEADFRSLADAQNIPFVQTNDLNSPSSIGSLRSRAPDLGVSVSWRHVIGPEPISAVRYGILNVHGGLLPKYRGNACQAWAILNGETEIGVTCHVMEPGAIDSGPIVLQRRIQVTEDTLVGELFKQCEGASRELMLEAVRRYAAGKVELHEQDERQATYCYPRLPRDGELKWSEDAESLERLVRAAGRPYEGAYSYFEDVRDERRIKKLTILRAHIEHHPIEFFSEPGHLLRLEGGKRWAVVTGDALLLVLDEILLDGEAVSPSDCFKSVRQRLGIDVSSRLASIQARLDALEARVTPPEDA